MDDQLRKIFATEIAHQCRYLMLAVADALRAHQVMEEVGGGHDDLWRSIHAALSASAMISKLATDRKGQTKIPRGPLREALGIDPTSPFLQRPLVRNYFEHLDERLEEWAAAGSGWFIDRVVGPASGLFVEGGEPTLRFHQYDPATTTVTILSQSIELSSLALAARELLPEAERLAREY